MTRAALAAVLYAGLLAAASQDVAAQEVSSGQGAVLRLLDKITGQSQDVAVPVGGATEIGPYRVALRDCRYPTGNPAGDAFAYLVIGPEGGDALFQGWMIGSSPALNALDHPRYDVWVIRCKTS